MATLPSGLPDHVDDDEDLARFLTQRNQFNSLMAKPAAFLPSPKDRETSVSWIEDDPELQKARQKEMAVILAGEAKPVLR